MLITMAMLDYGDDDDDDDDDGLQAHSHHDKFPPWWVFVRDDYGGILSRDKFPSLMMMMKNFKMKMKIKILQTL